MNRPGKTPMNDQSTATTQEKPRSEPAGQATGETVPLGWLYPIFWLSGFSALLYQMIWQRKLFTIYGTNIESVTIVVSAFMLGLGLGSLCGGVFSKNPRRSILLWFSLIEFGIGLYGLISLWLFDLVGRSTGGLSVLQTGLVSFGLVLLPTLLMGATLPLLVAHFVRQIGHVGRSVGLLYFVNTLGAAGGSFAAVMWVLGHMGLRGSINLAAALNLLVAVLVLLVWLKGRRR